MSPPATPSQTAGPFLHIGLLDVTRSELVAPDAPGAIAVQGLLLDGGGAAVTDAIVELWQADADGHYTSDPARLLRSDTRADGRFSFVTLKPGRAPAGDGALQAPHLLVSVFARGLLKQAVTRMYFPDEAAANAIDPVLGALDPERRETLVAALAPDGSLAFDIRLQGEQATVFFAL